jgi:hypothetical protein
MKRLQFASLALLGVVLMLIGGQAHAAPLYSQGFEVDTSGWNTPAGYGSVVRVASGTGGITSFAGSFHAVMTEDITGPYTFFGGPSAVWPTGGFSTQNAIYLDPAWATNSGFDYTVAAYNQGGTHLRDFIFHVTKDASTNQLLVGASNNTNFAPRQDLESIDHAVISMAGWYIFEHVFRDDGGALAVDLNLRDAGGNLVFSKTLSNPADLIASVVGGNGYGWFTFIDVAGGIAVDATLLSDAAVAVVPEPASLAIWSLMGMAGLAYRWRRKTTNAADSPS